MLYIILILAILFTAGLTFLLQLYTAWYHIFIIIGMFLGFYVGLVATYVIFIYVISLFIDKKKEVTKPGKFHAYIVHETMAMLLFFSRSRVHIEGKERLPKNERFLIVANHRSNFDPIICITKFSHNNLVFVSKPENFSLPIAGGFMHGAGFMAIDRDNPKNALVTINKAAEYLKNDVTNVAIFPEGTRNRTEEPLLEFKNGAFKIATKAKVPIVVVAMKNAGMVKKNFPWKSTRIDVKIVDVIPVEEVEKGRTAELSERARKAMLDYITQ